MARSSSGSALSHVRERIVPSAASASTTTRKGAAPTDARASTSRPAMALATNAACSRSSSGGEKRSETVRSAGRSRGFRARSRPEARRWALRPAVPKRDATALLGKRASSPSVVIPSHRNVATSSSLPAADMSSEARNASSSSTTKTGGSPTAAADACFAAKGPSASPILNPSPATRSISLTTRSTSGPSPP